MAVTKRKAVQRGAAEHALNVALGRDQAVAELPPAPVFDNAMPEERLRQEVGRLMEGALYSLGFMAKAFETSEEGHWFKGQLRVAIAHAWEDGAAAYQRHRLKRDTEEHRAAMRGMLTSILSPSEGVFIEPDSTTTPAPKRAKARRKSKDTA